MKKILFLIILIICSVSVCFAYNITAEKGLEKYIGKVEKEICPTVNEVVAAREKSHELFKHEKEMAKEMAYLLGCEDREIYISDNMQYYLYDSHVVLTTLNNIKLISYEKAKTNPNLCVGFLSYEFVNDGVNLVFSSMISDGEDKNFYLPILIDESGNIVKKDEIVTGLATVGGTGDLKGAMTLYQIVSETIASDLKIFYPFSRWYTEGMNYKITSLLLHKVSSPVAKDFDKLFAVTKESEKLKNQVNLWVFPQINLVMKNDYDHNLESAEIQYSCKLVNELYSKIGRDGFKKLNTELKYSELLTNEDICRIAKNVADVDLKSMLLDYIPESCANLIDTNVNVLFNTAYDLMAENKYEEAIPVLESGLTAYPYDLNARLNLGRCYREKKDIVNSDKNIFIAANATIPGETKISIKGEANEQIYVIVGKYFYMSGSVKDAYTLLSVAYEKDKSEDIKQILDKIELARKKQHDALYGLND